MSASRLLLQDLESRISHNLYLVLFHSSAKQNITQWITELAVSRRQEVLQIRSCWHDSLNLETLGSISVIKQELHRYCYRSKWIRFSQVSDLFRDSVSLNTWNWNLDCRSRSSAIYACVVTMRLSIRRGYGGKNIFGIATAANWSCPIMIRCGIIFLPCFCHSYWILQLCTTEKTGPFEYSAWMSGVWSKKSPPS